MHPAAPRRSHRSRVPGAALVAAGLLLPTLAPGAAVAQIRASEPASVAQTIDGTKITIDYFRPKARGRSPLFGHGGVVWEHIWTPGANWSTSIAFEKPITLEGEALDPGVYSIWMVMSEDEHMPVELVLHPDERIFHTNPPDLDEAAIRLPLTLHDAPHREMLSWEFEDVRTTGATLAFRWGGVRIPFEIGVEPTMRQVATDDEAEPVLGRYTLSMGPDGAPPVTFTVTRGDDGTVHADIEGVPEQGPAWLNEVDLMLIPLGDRIFGIGEAWDGTLGEVWPGVTMEFEMGEGPAAGFQMRDEDDNVMGRGERAG